MTKLKVAALCFTAALAVAATGFSAQAQELRPIGQVEFEPEPYALEKDVFQIKPEDRRVRTLRIEADEGSADIRSLLVTYADGEQERVRVRQLLKEGERTAAFRLAEPRPIKSVEVSYLPKGPVTLLLLADSRRGPPPESWTELGCKSVGLIVDSDTVLVNSQDRFKALRLRSMGYDIDLQEMTVRYANGGRDRYDVRATIPSNGKTQAIPLRGDSRRIQSIDFIYSSKVISNVKTKLCVDGLKSSPDDEEDQ